MICYIRTVCFKRTLADTIKGRIMSIDSSDLEKGVYTLPAPSYASQIRSLLAVHKLPRRGGELVYMSDSESLTPLLRLFFKKRRFVPLAREYYGRATLVVHKDETVEVENCYDSLRVFIWTTRSKDQLFIKSEDGAFVGVGFDELEEKLTFTQRALLHATLKYDTAWQQKIIDSQDASFQASLDKATSQYS